MRLSKRALWTLPFLLIALFFLLFYPSKRSDTLYMHNTGKIFGTYYNIRYQHADNSDLQPQIDSLLNLFNSSLSTFDKESVISKINQNRSHQTDSFFYRMFVQAEQISEITNGAFDLTVAPLVNAWGFGFSKKEEITPLLLDSLRQFVGYQKVWLEQERIVKADERIMLDASAIAKGYSCDVVAQFLESKGCENYLIDIGGEVVCKGISSSGKPWRVGINKPIDDPSSSTNEIQAVLNVSGVSLATSGNYRQFYFDEEGKKRSHTIDPRTGYPVNHNLLSATVIASNCMRADALATACMVLGVDSALSICSQLPDAECYLIYVDEDNRLQVTFTAAFEQYLN